MRFLDLIMRNLTIIPLLLGFLGTLTWFLGKWWGRISRRQRTASLSPRGHRVVSLTLFTPLLVGLLLQLPLWVPDCHRQAQIILLDWPDTFCPGPPHRKLIIFFHGWSGDAQETWRAFPYLVCGDSRFHDVDVLVIHYPTYMASRNLDITGLARWIDKELQQHGFWERYARVAIVAHSMGGLIGREVVMLAQLAGRENKVGLMIEIATPHLGSDVASLASALGLSRPLTEEMRRGSSFLQGLENQWSQLKNRPHTHCYTSPQDSVVPPDSATHQCDEILQFPTWGHTDLAKPKNWEDSRYSLPMSEVAKYMQLPPYMLESYTLTATERDARGMREHVEAQIEVKALEDGPREIQWGTVTSTGAIRNLVFRALNVEYTPDIQNLGGQWQPALTFAKALQKNQRVSLVLEFDVLNPLPQNSVDWSAGITLPTGNLQINILVPGGRPCARAGAQSQDPAVIGQNRRDESLPVLADANTRLTWTKTNPELGRTYIVTCYW